MIRELFDLFVNLFHGNVVEQILFWLFVGVFAELIISTAWLIIKHSLNK